jgi:hypothetical protein
LPRRLVDNQALAYEQMLDQNATIVFNGASVRALRGV